MNETEMQRFEEDGFLCYEDVFSPAEVAELVAGLDAPEDRVWESSQETIHSLGLTQRSPLFLKLARDPRLVRLLIPLIGPNIQLQHSKLAAKPPVRNAGPFGWHQDFAYFPHTNTDLVAIMVLLDDATSENGCMNMVRGSHKLGLLNHTDADGYFVGQCQDKVWEEQPHHVVPITLRAGGISVHHCLTLHGSGPNLSGRPRRGIVFQYRAADAYQMADTLFSDTGVQIHGAPSDTARCSGATWRLPKVRGRAGQGYGSIWNQQGAFALQVNAEPPPTHE